MSCDVQGRMWNLPGKGNENDYNRALGLRAEGRKADGTPEIT